MAMLSGGVNSPYYAGLNLVIIGSISWLPLNNIQLGISALTVYLPYFVLLFFQKEPLNYSLFVPNGAFILSTIFLGIITNFLTRKLRKSEIKNRIDLIQEIETKEEIIKQKTKEGIYLEKLTAQFSPQVIEGIKSNNINLDTKQRKEITCIFIDVINSTDRSIRLDHNEYKYVISDFFSECINIFLNHNVTVGTYLGDGIMAFTNAPKDNKNHEKMAFEACIEILKFYHKKKKYYSDLWKNEFNIRIGINSGYAYIGFFPSLKRGTYTAIGETVNLSSRLCTVALPNSICLTKKFLLKISDNIGAFQVSKIDTHIPIKGFEDDHFDLFSVKAKEDLLLNNEIDKCPLCNSPMAITSTFDNCNLIKCTNCNYTDIQEVGKKAA
jgi:class 3 adenylate cyclase